MLSAEMFKKIGESSCREEKELLCSLNGISSEEFERLWPLEKFGRAVLEHDIILLQVEHLFEANPAYFDSEEKGPRMTHSLVITYTTPISDVISPRSEYYESSRIEVNWLEMTPSLEKAIHEAFTARRG